MIKRLQKAVSIISLCSLLLTASYINVHAEYTKASSKHGMGYIPDPVRETTSTSSSFIKQYTKKATNAPESYDLRDYGLVTPVKDQGTCYRGLPEYLSVCKRNRRCGFGIYDEMIGREEYEKGNYGRTKRNFG